jgi:hypothetical protein
MVWRDDIHASWSAATIVMDATMPIEIVRQFYPGMSEPSRVAAPMPHTHVRQIADRAMSAEMLIPGETANERTNATRGANIERVRRFLQVRAVDVRPGTVLVVCQSGLEEALFEGRLSDNADSGDVARLCVDGPCGARGKRADGQIGLGAGMCPACERGACGRWP